MDSNSDSVQPLDADCSDDWLEPLDRLNVCETLGLSARLRKSWWCIDIPAWCEPHYILFFHYFEAKHS
jgi:hypothetical protein